MPSVEVVLSNPYPTTKPLRDIPQGFFTGTLGAYTGLFFRSAKDLTYLGPNLGFTQAANKPLPYWGYEIGSSVSTDVTNYFPVEVRIEVK